MPQTKYYLSDVALLDTIYHKAAGITVPSDTNSTGWQVHNGTGTGAQVPTYVPGWRLGQSGAIVNPGDSAIVQPETGTVASLVFQYRTSRLFTSFGPGLWQLNIALHGDKHTMTTFSLTGKINARLFKSRYPDGFDPLNVAPTLATEISPGLGQSNGFTITDNGAANALISFANMRNVQFEGEYLFIVLALEIGVLTYTAGGLEATRDADIIIDFGTGTYLQPPVVVALQNEDICAPSNYSEMYTYISPDGVHYPLDVDGRRVVLNDQGTGMPPLDYITQRGPFQHGETLLATYAKPRVVQLMVLHKFDNRDSWWNGRSNLIQQLSPRKQAIDGAVQTGTLRRILSTGEKRDLNCLIQEGPKFNPRADKVWDELSYTEALRFIGFDPIYYDPIVRSYIFDQQGSQLVFPAVFPISFTTIQQTVKFDYDGTWLTYPKFIITGTMTFIKIWNITTDEVISITYDLTESRFITIDLQPGSKTVTLDDGTNLLSAVHHTSNIGTFHLTETNGGVNEIFVHMIGVYGKSRLKMEYNPRYLGI